MHGTSDGVIQVRIMFNPILFIRGSVKNRENKKKVMDWPLWPEDELQLNAS